MVCRTIMRFLGFIVDKQQNRPAPDYVGRVLQTNQPTTQRQLRSFNSVCNWIRDYIPNFAELVCPLTALLSLKRRQWSRPLALDRPFVLQIDASDVGIATVLYQDIKERRSSLHVARSHQRSKAQVNQMSTPASRTEF